MDEFISAFVKSQESQKKIFEQLAESQKRILELLVANQTSSATASNPSDLAVNSTQSIKTSQFSNLADRLGKFVYDPTSNKTFTFWFERHENTFSDGAIGLTDDEKRQLLLNALGDDEYQRLVSRLSPKKPYEFSFNDLVNQLKVQFHDNKTIFQRRFEAINFRPSPPISVTEILDQVNVIGDNFQIDKFNIDQLKIMLAILALSDHSYQTERALLFKLASEKESCIFDEARNICFAHAQRTADVMRVEHNQPAEINAVNQHQNKKIVQQRKESKLKAKSFAKENSIRKQNISSCNGCGSISHKRQNCPFKEATCRACNKVGHIAKVCRSQKNKVNIVSQSNEIDRSHPHRKFVNIKVNGKPIVMQLDTGADVTMIGKKSWTKLGRPKLKPYGKSCANVCGDPITVIGSFDATFQFKDRTAHGPIIVHNRVNSTLLSSKILDELKLVKYDQDVIENHYKINAVRDVQLCSKYKDLFREGIGECNITEVSLRVGQDARPIHVPRRPIPLSMEEAINSELDRLVSSGILTPVSASDWAAPIVVARKANGKIRICADYSTGLNDALYVDEYPIPNIEEIMAKLQGNTIFSQIDLSDAYLHLKLDEQSRHLTTINTHRGLFEYNRLVFGLRSAPAIFQRTLEQLIKDIPGVLVYLDDILITGRNAQEHKSRLHEVLNRLQKAGFRLQTDKCKFHTTTVKYLGYVIDADGIKPDPSRIQPIKKMRAPQNAKELRSFLGLINYYGKFVQNLHRVKAPFESLLKKDVKFVWTKRHKMAFEEVKRIIMSPLVLAHYDPRQTLIVAADASETGIGGALLQRYEDGRVKAVFHMSKTLTETQRNYSQIEKEALALITTIERFRKFVYGRHFILQTDHRPLLVLFKRSNTKGLDPRTANRLKRWALRLIGYDFEIEYVKTTEFGQADALSRLIEEARKGDKDNELEDVIAKLQASEIELQQIVQESVQILPRTTRQEFAKETLKDGILAEVIDRLQTGWLESDSSDNEIAPYYRRRQLLSIMEGTLISDDKPIVPQGLRARVMQQLHVAHPGIRRMIQLAREYFYWPKMHNDIENFVKNCKHCVQTASYPIKEPLHPWPNASRPWSRIHIDFAGPILGQWILIVVDSYSKLVDAECFTTITSSAACQSLAKLFYRFGPPDTIVSDNGTQFTSEQFAKLCAEFNIIHLRSPPGHPQSNGQAERMVRTFKQSISVTTSSQLINAVNRFVYTYNYTPCESAPNGRAPAEVFYGRKLRTPFESYRGKVTPNDWSTTKQTKMKQQFDSHHGTKRRHFEKGQKVTVQLSNGKRVTGTFQQCIGKTIARIRVNGKDIIRHFNQIWNSVPHYDDMQQPDTLIDLMPETAQPSSTVSESTPNPTMDDDPTLATKVQIEHAPRRSKRLAVKPRTDFKILHGTRCRRGQIKVGEECSESQVHYINAL